MPDQIICPNCGKPIQITEALSKEIQKQSDLKHKQELEKIEKLNAEKIRELQSEQVRKLEQKELEIKKQMWDKAKEKAEEKFSLELKDLREKTNEDDKRKKEMEEQILEARKKTREMEEKVKKEKLELEKKLDEERQKIIKDAEEKADGDYRLKLLELEKKQRDTEKALEEARRKSQQGSQQNQGEVLELDLEAKLKEFFPTDLIEPVGKGVNGADLVQTVCSKGGSKCGVILYEIKQTKRFSEGWISKLKDDLRSAKANIPVLITIALPDGINGFGYYQNIWVVSPGYVTQLAISLRKNLIAVSYERAISAGKGKKSEMLFDYISSHEFRQKVEALVEVFSDMQLQLTKEKVAFEKQWSQREKQIQRLLLNTAGMYGDMQGLVGSSMPEIKGLEMAELESGEEQKLF